MTLAEKIGAVLTAARGAKARRELARELDVAPSTLHKIEHGRENLTLGRLDRLAAGYGVELEVVARRLPDRRAPDEDDDWRTVAVELDALAGDG